MSLMKNMLMIRAGFISSEETYTLLGINPSSNEKALAFAKENKIQTAATSGNGYKGRIRIWYYKEDVERVKALLPSGQKRVLPNIGMTVIQITARLNTLEERVKKLEATAGNFDVPAAGQAGAV